MAGIFDRALEEMAKRVPEALLLAVVGEEGIPVARRLVGAQPRFETITAEVAALDLNLLELMVRELGDEVSGFAVASQFATRNPAHEIAARDLPTDLLIALIVGMDAAWDQWFLENLEKVPPKELHRVAAQLLGAVRRLLEPEKGVRR